jgi:hypothetical protein
MSWVRRAECDLHCTVSVAVSSNLLSRLEWLEGVRMNLGVGGEAHAYAQGLRTQSTGTMSAKAAFESSMNSSVPLDGIRREDQNAT